MTSKHQEKPKKRKFCVSRAKKCSCATPNQYIENCRPSWGQTTLFGFKYKRAMKTTKVFEAHHIVCVSAVNEAVANAGDAIKPILKGTQWCVNNKDNMIALPLWGNTVRWYCEPGSKLVLKAGKGPPGFADLPQHDWDHNGKSGAYINEIQAALAKVVRAVNKKAKSHEVQAKDLASNLNGISTRFRAQLISRGQRNGCPGLGAGGTHGAWELGQKHGKASGSDKEKYKHWYLPFSMATKANATAKGYPAMDFDDQVTSKLAEMASRICG